MSDKLKKIKIGTGALVTSSASVAAKKLKETPFDGMS